MKSKTTLALLCALLILALAGCPSLSGGSGFSSGSITPSGGGWLYGDALVQSYVDYLESEGYGNVKVKDGSTIYFEDSDGFYFHLVVYTDDPTYFQIEFPNYLTIDTKKQLARCYAAMAVANAGTKCAKLYLKGSSVWGSAEIVLATPDMYKSLVPRMLNALKTCAETFASEFGS